MEEKRTSLQKAGGIFALFVAASIWGFAFAAQRQSTEFLSPQFFLALRSFLGSAALMLVVMLLDVCSGRKPSLWGRLETRAERKTFLRGGLCCGVVLWAASLLQQWGLVYATAGKAGFLTALYIVLVPILGLFFKRKTSWLLWIAVILVLYGSYLLCAGSGFGKMNIGDLLLFLCAAGYAGHIMVIDHFAPKTDCVRMSCMQFLICGILALTGSLIVGDTGSWKNVVDSLGAILFCGLCSSGIAYTAQIIGQKYVHPVMACLLMSLESVFSALGGYFFLGEILSRREIAGCSIIFLAVLMAQIPLPQKK